MSSIVVLAGPDGQPRIVRANTSARFRGQVFDTQDPEAVLPGSAVTKLDLTIRGPDGIMVITPATDIQGSIDAVTGDIDYVLGPDDNPLVGQQPQETHYLELDYSWNDGIQDLDGQQVYALNLEGTPTPADSSITDIAVLDASGNLTIVRGDDYDGQSTPAPAWPVPDDWVGFEAGATAKVGWRGTSGAEEFPAEVDVSNRAVILKLTSAETIKLTSAAALRYDVQVTLAGAAAGLVRTLAFGNLTILDTYTDR